MRMPWLASPERVSYISHLVLIPAYLTIITPFPFQRRPSAPEEDEHRTDKPKQVSMSNNGNASPLVSS